MAVSEQLTNRLGPERARQIVRVPAVSLIGAARHFSRWEKEMARLANAWANSQALTSGSGVRGNREPTLDTRKRINAGSAQNAGQY